MKKNRNSKNKPSPVSALALIAGTALARNLLFPMYADDYAYSFIWDSSDRGNLLVHNRKLKRVRNIRDLAVSQISHYRTWGGRSVAHTLDQAFLTGGKKVFNLANTGVTVLQIVLAERLGAGKEKLKGTDPRLYLWLAGGYWFCTPHLAACAEWMTGAFNYLWMGVLQAAFVLPYGKYMTDPGHRVPAAWMVPLGLLAGWSNEAGAGASVLYAGMASAHAALRKEKLPVWALTGICSGCLGMAAMLLAPGNRKRIELTALYEETPDEDDPDRTPRELHYKPGMFRHHLRNGFSRTVLRQLPLHLPAALYFTPLGKRCRETTEKILSLEAAAFSVPCALLLSPEFPERAAYPSVIFAMASSAAALRHLDPAKIPAFCKKAAFLPAALLAGSVCAAFLVDASLFRQTKRRLADLKKQEGRDPVVISKYKVPKAASMICGNRAMDDYGLVIDLEEDPESPYNQLYAQYYGIGRVSAADPDNRIGNTAGNRKAQP